MQRHMQSCMQGVRTGSQQQKNMTDTYTKDREQHFDICRWEIISQTEDNKERVQTLVMVCTASALSCLRRREEQKEYKHA